MPASRLHRQTHDTKLVTPVVHSTKVCHCCYCARRRARIVKVHKVVTSKWARLTVFLLVAVTLAAIAEHKWVTGLSGGVVATKLVELIGEIVADRMLPAQMLGGQ